jgi:hypothetical protein
VDSSGGISPADEDVIRTLAEIEKASTPLPSATSDTPHKTAYWARRSQEARDDLSAAQASWLRWERRSIRDPGTEFLHQHPSTTSGAGRHG